VKACAEVATDKAKPATAINLIIILLLVTRPTTPTAQSNAAFGFRPRLPDFSAGVAQRVDMDQGRIRGWSYSIKTPERPSKTLFAMSSKVLLLQSMICLAGSPFERTRGWANAVEALPPVNVDFKTILKGH
jgi:hypothetical protein